MPNLTRGLGNLRVEYEMKQEVVPIESDEVIPTRDSRAVEAMARSGRRLRPLKQTVDDSHPRSEHRESVTWIAEEKMKIWQIDLYHRVTEDGGVNINRTGQSCKNAYPSVSPKNSEKWKKNFVKISKLKFGKFRKKV